MESLPCPSSRFTLKCRCGYEEAPTEPEPFKINTKVPTEIVVTAGSEFKVPGDYKKHDPILRWRNLTAGKKESKIDLYHKGAIPELLTKLRTHNKLADGSPGPFTHSYEDLAHWLNEKALNENKVSEAMVDWQVVRRWAKSNVPERSGD